MVILFKLTGFARNMFIFSFWFLTWGLNSIILFNKLDYGEHNAKCGAAKIYGLCLGFSNSNNFAYQKANALVMLRLLPQDLFVPLHQIAIKKKKKMVTDSSPVSHWHSHWFPCLCSCYIHIHIQTYVCMYVYIVWKGFSFSFDFCKAIRYDNY